MAENMLTITISRETINFLMAGMAYTTYTGKAETQARRAVAQAEFDAAVNAALKEARA